VHPSPRRRRILGPPRAGTVTAVPELLHVGSACRDVDESDPRGWRLGGGVAYSALASARLGLRTAAIVGVDDEARDAHELELLREAGVELLLVHLEEGPVYHNVETAAGRVQTCVRVGVPLPIPDIPSSLLASPTWMLAPVADELDDRWSRPPADDAFVAVSWQGLLRDLRPGAEVRRRPPRPSRLIRRADLVGLSRRDVAPGTPVTDLLALLRPGVLLVVTDGARGGVLVVAGADGRFEEVGWNATPSEAEVDATGAGDTFLSALVATIARPGDRVGRTLPDLAVAAAAGSLVVEGPGLGAVPHRARVDARVARHRARQARILPGPRPADPQA
jgi:sugar/nucleoside kinase (ribokinase family)